MPYTCYTNPPNTFAPAFNLIATITNSNPASITTVSDHEYVSGLIVRLHIPESYGMIEANNLTGEIIVTGDNSFTINIDTTSFTPFALNPIMAANPTIDICPQVIPIGENNSILSMAEHNTLSSGS